MDKFKEGDIVLIPFRHVGGQVVATRPDRESYNVRLTSFNPFTNHVEDHIEVFDEEELVPSPKEKGVIIL